MSRERQFCEREVLHRVTALFAEHGYKGTSLAMLLEATGLGKQSLYNCFGDKRALYLHALDAAATRYAGLRDRMREAPTGRAGLAVYFDQLVQGCAGEDSEWRHCIVAGGLLEHVDDPLLRARLGESWSGAHELLREQVERGQRDGSIVSPLPSAELADLLLGVAAGLRVNAGARFSPERLRRTVDLALATLDARELPQPS